MQGDNLMAAKKNTVTYNGTGRRKTSVARVFMTPGKGSITVNGKTLDEYLPLETLRMDRISYALSYEDHE